MTNQLYIAVNLDHLSVDARSNLDEWGLQCIVAQDDLSLLIVDRVRQSSLLVNQSRLVHQFLLLLPLP